MKKKEMLLTAAILGSLTSSTVFAAPPSEDKINDSFTLEQVVVTAQRQRTKELDTPASVSVITEKDIKKSGVSTVYEIIEQQVGFTNNAYGPGGREYGGSNSRTVIRGLDKGTLVMVNGAPINMLNYNSMDGIPVESVEKIEIVRGANSVLYGSEAFGGVVNIITKKGGGESQTTVSTGIGNYDRKWSLTNVGENYMVAINRSDFGELDQTNQVSEKTKAKWRFGDSHKENAYLTVALSDKLDFNWAHSKGDYVRDSLTLNNQVATGDGTRYNYEDTRDNLSLVFDDQESQFKSVLSYNRRKVDPHKFSLKNFTVSAPMPLTSEKWNMYTSTLDNQKGWDLRDGKDKLIAGVTFNKEDMTDYTKQNAEAARDSIALYTSYTYQFDPKFSTTFGMRGQFINDYAKDQNVFLPQLQTLYKIDNNTSWYTNIGKSFQMPALNQYFNKGRTDQLKPQEGWTYETGLKWINGKDSWKLAAYHMDIDGKFEWLTKKDYPYLDEDILINAGKFKNTGIEMEFNRKVDEQWKYKLGVSVSDPQTQAYNSSDWKQSDAKLQYTAGIEYSDNKLSSTLTYLYLGNREDSYYRLDGSSGSKSPDHRTPARQELNLNFNYQADLATSVSLQLNNILGKDNSINRYENWGMPFNWMLTVQQKF